MGKKITWSNERRKLRDLVPWEYNPRQINRDNARRLGESFEDFGQVETIAVGPNNEVYNGHQRLKVLMDKYGADYEVDVRVASRALSDKERQKLIIFLHRGAVGEWDFDMLANVFEFDELIDWGFSEKELGFVGDDEQNANPIDDLSDDIGGAFALKSDMRFDSDEPLEIPPLRKDMLLDIPDNLAVWPGDDIGSDSDDVIWLLIYSYTFRKIQLSRTILAFYTGDERFEKFWDEPDKWAGKLINAGIYGCVAPNFSLWPYHAAAIHVYNVYRSRWLGRYLQECGIRVLPDANWASYKDYGFCFAGIPKNCNVSVQVQTVNPKRDDEVLAMKDGILEMIRQIEPTKILFYGAENKRGIIEEMKLNAPYIILPTLMDLRRGNIKRKETLP